MHVQDILALVLGVVGIISAIGGGLAWYAARVKKSYAAERDFNHLKNHYEALSMNVEQLWRQNDERFDRIDLKLNELGRK